VDINKERGRGTLGCGKHLVEFGNVPRGHIFDGIREALHPVLNARSQRFRAPPISVLSTAPFDGAA
jgi:hypothetical protein